MVSERVFLLHFLFMGAFICFVYDLLRVFRRAVPHAGFAVAAEDFGFWVYCGSEVFLLLHREGNGSLRWFAVLGALAGMLLYGKTVSRPFVKHASSLLSGALAALGKLLGWLCAPFLLAGRKAGSAGRRAGRSVKERVKKGCRAMRRKLTFFLKIFKMNLRA